MPSLLNSRLVLMRGKLAIYFVHESETKEPLLISFGPFYRTLLGDTYCSYNSLSPRGSMLLPGHVPGPWSRSVLSSLDADEPPERQAARWLVAASEMGFCCRFTYEVTSCIETGRCSRREQSATIAIRRASRASAPVHGLAILPLTS